VGVTALSSLDAVSELVWMRVGEAERLWHGTPWAAV
jgi:hypothetical protein